MAAETNLDLTFDFPVPPKSEALEMENARLRRMIESFRQYNTELREELVMVYNENNALKRQIVESAR